MQPSLWKHDNGTWYIRWSDGKGSKRLSTGTSDKAEAEVELERFLDGGLRSARTVSQLLDLYFEQKSKTARSAISIKASIKALKRTIGYVAPHNVGNETARKFADMRKNEGVKNGTIIKDLGCLRAALRRGQKEGWVRNPGQFEMPVSAPPPRDRWLTEDEAKALLKEAHTPHLKLFIALALSTGARRSAILELTWDRVDLARNTIDFGEGHGKKRRAKNIPIADDIAELLKLHHTYRVCDHVVEFQGKPISSVRTSLNKAAERAGIPKLGTHVFRHTCATWAVSRGESFERVAKMLNTTVDMVESVYGHHAPDYLRSTITSGLLTM